MFAPKTVARAVALVLGTVAAAVIVSIGFLPSAQADDTNKAGSASGSPSSTAGSPSSTSGSPSSSGTGSSTTSGGTGSSSTGSSSGMGSVSAGGTGSSQAGLQSSTMTYSDMAKMSPSEQMKLMDKDNKGYVTKDEFMNFQAQLWRNMDKNNDGRITREEWEARP